MSKHGWWWVLLLTVFLMSCSGGEKARLSNPNTPYLAGGGSSDGSGDGSDPISFWDGDGVQGPASVVVNLPEQRAYFYKGDQLVGVSQISAGREGHNTPSGNYKITQKEVISDTEVHLHIHATPSAEGLSSGKVVLVMRKVGNEWKQQGDL